MRIPAAATVAGIRISGTVAVMTKALNKKL